MVLTANIVIFTDVTIAVAILYFASAALFRRALWLYPALAVTHLALLAYLLTLPPTNCTSCASVPFHILTWVIALIGYAFSRRSSSVGRFPDAPFAGYVLTDGWARPFLIFSALDLGVWQNVAAQGIETAVIVGTGSALLVVLLASLWQDALFAHAAFAFAFIALFNQLKRVGFADAETCSIIGGIGFGLYLLAWASEFARAHLVALWRRAFANAGIFYSALAVLLTLPTLFSDSLATAAAFAFAGALCLALAYRTRRLRASYLGLAFLEFAWMLVLFRQDIREPQYYALPAGLYLGLIGFLERRRARLSANATNRLIALSVEGAGLAVLLLTSFIQSLNGATGFPYFVLLIVEALAVIGYGAFQHFKIPFFAGIGAMALNVLAQVAVLVNVYDINRFEVIFIVGILLVFIAVLVERLHTRIIAKAKEWLVALEEWE